MTNEEKQELADIRVCIQMLKDMRYKKFSKQKEWIIKLKKQLLELNKLD